MTWFYYSWVIAVPCALGSRLLLNMRERYYTDDTANFQGTFPQHTEAGIELHNVRPARVAHGMSFSTM
jgi:hypothetical protein